METNFYTNRNSLSVGGNTDIHPSSASPVDGRMHSIASSSLPAGDQALPEADYGVVRGICDAWDSLTAFFLSLFGIEDTPIRPHEINSELQTLFIQSVEGRSVLHFVRRHGGLENLLKKFRAKELPYHISRDDRGLQWSLTYDDRADDILVHMAPAPKGDKSGRRQGSYCKVSRVARLCAGTTHAQILDVDLRDLVRNRRWIDTAKKLPKHRKRIMNDFMYQAVLSKHLHNTFPANCRVAKLNLVREPKRLLPTLESEWADCDLWTLAERIRDNEIQVPDRERVRIMHQVLIGAYQFRLSGVIHGDFKADNVLVVKEKSGKYRIWIGDLGSSFLYLDREDRWKQLFRKHTYDFMAPEGFSYKLLHKRPKDVHNAVDFGIQMDDFSTGATLYTFMTGNKPFPGWDPNIKNPALLRTREQQVIAGLRSYPQTHRLAPAMEIAHHLMNPDVTKRWDVIDALDELEKRYPTWIPEDEKRAAIDATMVH